MHINDAVFLEDLCPKFRLRQWRKSIHKFTGKSCIYCGKPSESIDNVLPRSQGGLSTTENCVPACLSCNGDKSDENALYWYRRQKFYDPRRAMAIRAWLEGDLRLAIRLLQWQILILRQVKIITKQMNQNTKLPNYQTLHILLEL